MNLNFTTKLNIYRFFDDFVLIYPLYALMFEESGVSVSHISVLFLVWSVTSFLLEVPSGVLADKYDRKTLLVVAQTIRIIGYLSWLIFPNFWGFLIGFIFWGIKSALTSGTREAFLYDGLEAKNSHNTYAKDLGVMKTISLIAVLTASGLASITYPLGYPLILILSILSLIISNIALLSIENIRTKKSTDEKEYFKILFKGVRNVVRKSEVLLIVAIGAFFVGIMAIDEYFSLFIAEKGITKTHVGVAFALFILSQSIGSLVAHKFEKNEHVLNISLVIFSVFFTLFPILPGIMSFLILCTLAFVASIAQVVSSSKLQSKIEGDTRATIGSAVGFLAEITAFAVYITTSVLSEHFNLINTFRYLSYGVMICIIVFVLWRMFARKLIQVKI